MQNKELGCMRCCHDKLTAELIDPFQNLDLSTLDYSLPKSSTFRTPTGTKKSFTGDTGKILETNLVRVTNESFTRHEGVIKGI